MIVMALVCLSSICHQASARYLPTRSDESRRERIKEVLRLVSQSLINILINID